MMHVPVLLLSRWIYDGELHDAHSEFFVAENPDASVAQQWEQKYGTIALSFVYTMLLCC